MSQFLLSETWKTNLKISKGKYLVTSYICNHNLLYIQTQNSNLQLQLSHRNCTPCLLKILSRSLLWSAGMPSNWDHFSGCSALWIKACTHRWSIKKLKYLLICDVWWADCLDGALSRENSGCAFSCWLPLLYSSTILFVVSLSVCALGSCVGKV